MMFKVWRA